MDSQTSPQVNDQVNDSASGLPATGEPNLAIGTATGIATDGSESAVLLHAGQVFDLAQVAGDLGVTTPVTTLAVLENWERALPVLLGLADTDTHTGTHPDGWVPLASVRVTAPVRPRQVIQAGANYRTHVLDLAVKHAPAGADLQQVRADAAAQMDARIAGGEPYFFIGLPSAVAGPDDDVVLPPGSDAHDWELELAAVIGTRAFRVGRGDALAHVAGYTVVNDLTTRDLVFRRDMPEIGTDWFRAKNSPGFLPLGPWIVPAALAGDPQDLRLTLTLNGRTMQDESTKDMMFDVAALVSAASQTTPLLPGDLILTGSPAGNGLHHGRLLRAGDQMVATITGLGAQHTRCVTDPSA